MKDTVKEVIKEAKLIPKSVWITAIVVPGGLIALASYLTSVTIYKKQQEKKNEDS